MITQPVFTAYEFKLCYKGLERNALSERRCRWEFCLKTAVVIKLEKGQTSSLPLAPQDNVHSDFLLSKFFWLSCRDEERRGHFPPSPIIIPPLHDKTWFCIHKEIKDLSVHFCIMWYYAYISNSLPTQKGISDRFLETQVFIISSSDLSKLLRRRLAFNEMELGQQHSLQFSCVKNLLWPPTMNLPLWSKLIWLSFFSIEFKWEKHLSRSKGRCSHQLWGWQFLCSGTWCLPRAATHRHQSSPLQHSSGCHTAGKQHVSI